MPIEDEGRDRSAVSARQGTLRIGSSHRSLERGLEQIVAQNLQRKPILPTSESDLYPPKLCGNKFLLF